MDLIAWFRKQFRRIFKKEETKYYAEVKGWPEKWHTIPPPSPKPTKAIHQDYGKFFKGKGAKPLPHYRRAVKAKKQPEED